MDRKKNNKKLIIWYAFLWIFLFIALYLSYFVYFIDLKSTKSKWIALFAGAISLLMACCKTIEILYVDDKNSAIKNIVRYFSCGFDEFFKKGFGAIVITSAFLLCLISKFLGAKYAISYLFGVVFSCLYTFLLNMAQNRASSRIAISSRFSTGFIYKLAHNASAAIMGFMGAFILIPIVILYHITKDYQMVSLYLLGSCVVYIFYGLCAIIIKKSTKSASNVVDKITDGIKETDKRNPILLLTGISKSSFNIYPVNFDLFLSYTCVIISAIATGAMTLNLMGAFLPLIIAANGLFAAIIASLFTKVSKIKKPHRAFHICAIFAVIISLALSYVCIKIWFEEASGFTSTLAIGAVCSLVICYLGTNNISSMSKATRNISNASYLGIEYAAFQTLKEGLKEVFPPIAILSFSIALAFFMSNGFYYPLIGIYGIIIFILGYFSTSTIVTLVNSFGHLVDDSGYVYSTYEESFDVDEDKFKDIVGNSGRYLTSSIKQYINSASILASIALIIAFYIISNMEEIDILNPFTLFSLFLGAALPFLYYSFIMSGISKTTVKLIFEVKRQFRKYPEILGFQIRPNYIKPIHCAYSSAFIRVIFTIFIVCLVFFLDYIYLGIDAISGFIIGLIITSMGLIYTISNTSQAAWGAYNHSQKENMAQKNPEGYEITCTNNQIFAMNKDLATICFGFLIKFCAILAIVFAPLFM